MQAQRSNPTNSSSTRPSGQTGETDGKNRQQILDAIAAEEDTFGVFYIHKDKPSEIYAVEDTSLYEFHRFDPAEKSLFAQANLGIIGSATRPVFYESRFRQGFDVGYHQYDLYYIQPESMRFHILEKPVAHIRAMQGSRQEDRAFEIAFGRNFAKGWRLNLESKSIQQLSTWKYPNQEIENRALGAGLWYSAPSGRYNGFLTFTSNTTEAEENGGITSTPAPGLELSTPNDATTALSGTAQTRHTQRTLDYTHYFNIQKQDSIPSKTREFSLAHTIQFQNNTYKYFDESDASTYFADSSYYNNLLLDERGVRHFLKHQAICNTFRLGTYKTTEAKAAKVASQRDRIEVGLTHRIHFLDQEAGNSIVNNLFVTGQIDFRPNSKLAIHTYAHFGLLDNAAGDYRISGDLFFDIGRVGRFSAKLVSQLYSPSIIQQQFVVTQQVAWKRDLRKTFENNLSATIAIPKLQLNITGNYHLLKNYIYFDTLAQVQQLDSTLELNILQLAAKHRLKLGLLHFDNTIGLQSTTNAVLRLPTWLSRHSLYIESTVFKKAALLQLGVDLRMNQAYYADSYFPLIGQFHLQDEAEIQLYPVLDAFLNVKIKTARIFVKAQNITHLLADKYYYNYYETSAYPQLPFFINFGFDWTLRN